ncbi:hypothetical protein KIH39_19080 [Telmatocola sphagniphila]|jgi:hypothetical protein|uniref:Uncharacterized protein n=1 Tax=Telmatocola sphagniphila TaxID=1123043 RepID=A0A8E6EU49_9BACT|nr:hypothetical protein [Telmatocola sphagniphila]QVL30940.1 hypothetical protein KIH39_19080 [Telmatocola sphagniphila]
MVNHSPKVAMTFWDKFNNWNGWQNLVLSLAVFVGIGLLLVLTTPKPTSKQFVANPDIVNLDKDVLQERIEKYRNLSSMDDAKTLNVRKILEQGREVLKIFIGSSNSVITLDAKSGELITEAKMEDPTMKFRTVD